MSRTVGGNTILFLVLGIGAGTVLFLFDPKSTSIYPVCPFHWLTGLDCPLCGSLRALHALLHARPVEAVHANVLTTLGVVYVAVRCIGRSLWNPASAGFHTRTPARPAIARALIAVALLFAVVRNMPFGWFSVFRP